MNTKPKIILIADTRGWAWWNKSLYLKKYLSDEFDIDVYAAIEKVLLTDNTNTKKANYGSYDLCVTYGHSFVSKLKDIPKRKRVTGVTAHRERSLLEPRINKAYAVHANSMLLYKQVKKFHPRVYYTPNGVDPALFKPKQEVGSHGKVIVAGNTSKLSPNKLQAEILEPAVKKAKVKYVAPYRKYFNRISLKEMVGVYQQFDVYINASKEDGTPNGLLEAAACERPILSVPIGNAPEFVKDGYNGFIIPYEIDAFVEKLKWFQKNRDKMIEMGKNARKTILEGWTWKQQVKNYRRMFRDLL